MAIFTPSAESAGGILIFLAPQAPWPPPGRAARPAAQPRRPGAPVRPPAVRPAAPSRLPAAPSAPPGAGARPAYIYKLPINRTAAIMLR